MSDTKKSVYKPRPVSGFPEWLPEVRLVEQQWFDHIRKVFESYGFCSIETPSVEELDVLSAKGEVDKEIYVIERLHRDENDKEARLALHFDQTVPLARYVAQHFNELVFPFKRYQMQRVWRGERPQAGRFREFYQCDIDVINVDALPLHFDAEMPAVMWEILTGLPGMENEKIQMQISNRKILTGMLQSLVPAKKNISDIIKLIDKVEKLERGVFIKSLRDDFGLHEDIIEHLVRTVITRWNMDEINDFKNVTLTSIDKSDSSSKLVEDGLNELIEVMRNLSHLPKDAVVIDLSIVRGLDYYTGTVYETRFMDDPTYGSICSGGRYDDLASGYINKSLPGVGISIGFSRLFARMLEKGKLPTMRKSPADILVVMPSDERRAVTAETAQTLRRRGFRVEMYHAGQKIKRQMEYASKKGIPYVWFPPFEEGGAHEVKNMGTGEQAQATPENWKKQP